MGPKEREKEPKKGFIRKLAQCSCERGFPPTLKGLTDDHVWMLIALIRCPALECGSRMPERATEREGNLQQLAKHAMAIDSIAMQLHQARAIEGMRRSSSHESLASTRPEGMHRSSSHENLQPLSQSSTNTMRRSSSQDVKRKNQDSRHVSPPENETAQLGFVIEDPPKGVLDDKTLRKRASLTKDERGRQTTLELPPFFWDLPLLPHPLPSPLAQVSGCNSSVCSAARPSPPQENVTAVGGTNSDQPGKDSDKRGKDLDTGRKWVSKNGELTSSKLDKDKKDLDELGRQGVTLDIPDPRASSDPSFSRRGGGGGGGRVAAPEGNAQSGDLKAGGGEEQRIKMAKGEGELGEDSEGAGKYSEEGGKYSEECGKPSAGGEVCVWAKDSAFPEAVPLDEEPEMQAQPGIFTNQRGNLKVRAFVTNRQSES